MKKIVRDFQPPVPRSDKGGEGRDGGDSDLIKEEDRPLAARFGIHTEAQRKKYMSEFIPMDLGGGVRFEDPKKGFVKTLPVKK